MPREHTGAVDGSRKPGKPFSVLAAPDERQNAVLEKIALSDIVRLFRVHCPLVAAYCAPGQFLIVRGDETGERIPLTIADFDRDEGWVTIVVQLMGAGTRKLDRLGVGDRFLDVLGPLGHKSEIAGFGTVVFVGGGVGIAPVYPIQRAMKAAGNTVLSIVGSRTKGLLFWEDKMRATSDEIFITTDDGSYGEKGFVTTVLKRLIDSGRKLDRVIAVGPPVMMRSVVETTRAAKIPTIVSLNSIMVDGTGMCGGCRVEVGGKTKFTCVDGPEFDGHQVDFKLLMTRLKTYDDHECRAVKAYEAACTGGQPGTCSEDEPSCLAAAEPAAGVQKAADRMPMPEQPPEVRRHNFSEVALGYTPAMAQAEALRCLQCKKKPCVSGCPVNIEIPSFIKLVQEGKFVEAARAIKLQNNLPAICGRVCPQETQCEEQCVLVKKGKPIAIGRLERFVADYEAAKNAVEKPALAASTGRRVAIVGAGPSGLTAAAELAKYGHRVTVFETLHAPGGVLIYGIPEFRLPKAVVCRECTCLEDMGVEFRTNTPVGQTFTGADLLAQGFDAVFVGTGAGLPWFMSIPGENAKGVYSSNEFLTRINLMKAFRFPEYDTPVLNGKRVAVVGGGNVAMDCARSALRIGAEHVYLVYRRTRAEMPARAEEAHHALEEGVEFMELTNPVRVVDRDGKVAGLECIKMELGEPDQSGRRRPIEVKGSEHVIDVDQMIMAIGSGPNPILTRSWPQLTLDKRGNIPVDAREMTNIPGVFAGGDIVTGAATVIEAMGAGKRAAKAIDEYLRARA